MCAGKLVSLGIRVWGNNKLGETFLQLPYHTRMVYKIVPYAYVWYRTEH